MLLAHLRYLDNLASSPRFLSRSVFVMNCSGSLRNRRRSPTLQSVVPVVNRTGSGAVPAATHRHHVERDASINGSGLFRVLTIRSSFISAESLSLSNQLVGKGCFCIGRTTLEFDATVCGIRAHVEAAS